MRLSTSLTQELGIAHPVVLAAMDVVADAKLVLAVRAAGGYGFLGAGYGDETWMRRELDFDVAAVIAGEAAGLIHDLPGAGDAIERMVASAAGLLGCAAGFVRV